MGDHGLIPLSEPAKRVADIITVPSAIAGFLGAFHWPTIAAILSCIYMAGRILEMVYGWWKRK